MSERAKELEPTLDRRLRWLADELLQCSCDEAYTSRGLIAPDCNGHDGYAETIAEVRTRLAGLRRELGRLREQYRIDHDIQPHGAAEARRRGLGTYCEECWSHHDPSRCPTKRERAEAT